MRSGLLIVLIGGLLRGTATAQESVPAASSIEDLKPVMTALQSGTWSPDQSKLVIDTLIRTDRRAAASWWVTLAEEAVKAKKLPPAAAAVLASQRKTAESEGASDDDRKLLFKVARHIESVVASKNFDEARSVLQSARVLATLVPDAGTTRTLDALEKKMSAGANQDPSNLPRQQKQFADMRGAIVATVAARLERELAEYEAAGCRPGRLVLGGAIKRSTALLGEDQTRSLVLRLDKAAHTNEPTRVLSLLIRPDDETHVYRNGVDDHGSFQEPREYKVLDGDLIQCTVPRLSALLPDGKRALHVAAFSARLDGKDLDWKSWFLNKAGDTGLLDPPLVPTEARRVEQKDARLKNFDVKKFPNGAFVTLDGKDHVAYQVTPECQKQEAEFAERKLKPRWVGAIAETCVVVLKIPED
jgi:hypothetical protein